MRSPTPQINHRHKSQVYITSLQRIHVSMNVLCKDIVWLKCLWQSVHFTMCVAVYHHTYMQLERAIQTQQACPTHDSLRHPNVSFWLSLTPKHKIFEQICRQLRDYSILLRNQILEHKFKILFVDLEFHLLLEGKGLVPQPAMSLGLPTQVYLQH
jgi:hypothetical protein